MVKILNYKVYQKENGIEYSVRYSKSDVKKGFIKGSVLVYKRKGGNKFFLDELLIESLGNKLFYFFCDGYYGPLDTVMFGRKCLEFFQLKLIEEGYMLHIYPNRNFKIVPWKNEKIKPTIFVFE